MKREKNHRKFENKRFEPILCSDAGIVLCREELRKKGVNYTLGYYFCRNFFPLLLLLLGPIMCLTVLHAQSVLVLLLSLLGYKREANVQDKERA